MQIKVVAEIFGTHRAYSNLENNPDWARARAQDKVKAFQLNPREPLLELKLLSNVFLSVIFTLSDHLKANVYVIRRLF